MTSAPNLMVAMLAWRKAFSGTFVSILHGLNSYHFLKYSKKQVSTAITLLHNYKLNATVRILRVPSWIPWPQTGSWLRHTVVHLDSSRQVLGFNLIIDLDSITPYLFHFITHNRPRIRPYNACSWRRVVKYTLKKLRNAQLGSCQFWWVWERGKP
jgi:hypothetical protein